MRKIKELNLQFQATRTDGKIIALSDFESMFINIQLDKIISDRNQKSYLFIPSVQETLDVPLMKFITQKSKFKSPIEPVQNIQKRIRPSFVANKPVSVNYKEKQSHTFAAKTGEYTYFWAEKAKKKDSMKLTMDAILKGLQKYITSDRFLTNISNSETR